MKKETDSYYYHAKVQRRKGLVALCKSRVFLASWRLGVRNLIIIFSLLTIHYPLPTIKRTRQGPGIPKGK